MEIKLCLSLINFKKQSFWQIVIHNRQTTRKCHFLDNHPQEEPSQDLPVSSARMLSSHLQQVHQLLHLQDLQCSVSQLARLPRVPLNLQMHQQDCSERHSLQQLACLDKLQLNRQECLEHLQRLANLRSHLVYSVHQLLEELVPLEHPNHRLAQDYSERLSQLLLERQACLVHHKVPLSQQTIYSAHQNLNNQEWECLISRNSHKVSKLSAPEVLVISRC